MYNHAPVDYVCPFCLLIQGIEDKTVLSVQSDVIYHDRMVSAFITVHQKPNNPGNVIVVPNEHYENIFDLPFRYAQEIHRVAKRLAFAMKTIYSCDGISTRQHNEPAGSQDVWHYHVHVTPRFEEDHFYEAKGALMPVEERAKHAQLLREALETMVLEE